MAKRSFAYLENDPEKIPYLDFHAAKEPLLRDLWQSLHAVRRLKVRNLEPGIDLLPHPADRIIREAIRAFSDEPKERPAELRSWFKGRLHPGYPIEKRIAIALGLWVGTYGSAQVTPHQLLLARKRGVPDPVGIALDFLHLVISRVTKVPFVQEPERRGYGRQIPVGFRAGRRFSR